MDDSQVLSTLAPDLPLETKDGPGQTLRAARERLKLSVEHVAESMHLSPRIIHALEADQYDTIANFTFVRGYLRTYARLLNISSDEIVQSFNRLHLTERTANNVKVEFSQRHTPVTGKNRKVLYSLTGFIVILLLSLMVIWQQHHNQISKKPSLFSKQIQQVPVKTVSQTVTIAKPVNVATNQQTKTVPSMETNSPVDYNTQTQEKPTQPKQPIKLLTPFKS